ncbi:MAG: hypothetical protein U0575_05950 [Phycisphaerales bacterium]
MRPSLRPADFDEEKVILEEIAMYDDQPFWVLYEHAMEAYYGDHPLAHRVLDEGVDRGARRDEMRRYFEHRYSADNTVLGARRRARLRRHRGRRVALVRPWQATVAVCTHAGRDGRAYHRGAAREDQPPLRASFAIPAPSGP